MYAALIPDWLSVTETVVKIVAILVGGGWTIYLFSALRQAARARLEYDKLAAERSKADYDIQKLRREIEKLDLEMKTSAVVAMTVSASQLTVPGDPRKVLSARVEVLNRGTRPVRLNYEGEVEPFAVTPVSFASDGTPVFGESLRQTVTQAANPSARALSTTIRPGLSEVLPFVCEVRSAGLFFVSFRVKATTEARKELQELGVPEENPLSWVGKTFAAIS